VEAGAARIGVGLGESASARDWASLVDHTLLKPEASDADIRRLCEEAAQYKVASGCVNPTWVKESACILRGSGVPVGTVVGFPLGATLADVKAYETRRAIFDGAREIDMVINIGALKSGDDCAVEYDIRAVVEAAHAEGVLVKTIIETALLTDEEKVRACLAAKRAGADFVKTSTGFAKSGATVADVALMRRTVGSEMGVKAAGGVKGISDAGARVSVLFTALGKDKKFNTSLKPEDIRVSVDGAAREVLELKRQSGVPLFLAVVIDTSASQESVLPKTKMAAGVFVRGMMSP